MSPRALEGGTQAAMKQNPLQQLVTLGQSVWLDDIRRTWHADGTLARLIEHDGVSRNLNSLGPRISSSSLPSTGVSKYRR